MKLLKKRLTVDLRALITILISIERKNRVFIRVLCGFWIFHVWYINSSDVVYFIIDFRIKIYLNFALLGSIIRNTLNYKIYTTERSNYYQVVEESWKPWWWLISFNFLKKENYVTESEGMRFGQVWYQSPPPILFWTL